MWIHGIGFIPKCNEWENNLTLSVMSVVFIVISEGFTFINLQYQLAVMYRSGISKEQLSALIITIWKMLLRSLLYCQNEKLNALSLKLSKICNKCNVMITSKFQIILSLLLIFHDLVSLSSILLLFYSLGQISSSVFQSRYFGAIPPPYSAIISYASMFSFLWNDASMTVVGYFCCICYFLKKCFTEIKKKHRYINSKSNNSDKIFQDYAEIANFVHRTNSKLHTFLLIYVCITVTTLFREMYWLLFSTTSFHSVTFDISCIIKVVYTFSVYTALCTLSSGVKESAADIRNEAQALLMNSNDLNILKYANKVFDQSLEFALLNSIVIDKNLILSTIGTSMTYGILIATFNLNISNKD